MRETHFGVRLSIQLKRVFGHFLLTLNFGSSVSKLLYAVFVKDCLFCELNDQVCWRFEGKKYDLAKQFNMSIVNHRWVEECIRRGRRVPEQPYLFQR